MALSDPIVLKDDKARKFLEELENPAYNETRALVLKKASEAAKFFAEK